jgi:hypothetical protein
MRPMDRFESHRMITYTEKGSGLHDAIRKAGHWLREENGVWLSSNDADVQAIIDGYDPLPGARDAKWEDIKAERDRRQVLGVRVGANLFHSDDKSRIQQLGLVMMGAGLPAGLQWKTMDGGFVTMTSTLAGQIFGATASSDQGIFAAAEVHNNAMRASANPADYDFSAGWPAA